jgi:hypothetical protein
MQSRVGPDVAMRPGGQGLDKFSLTRHSDLAAHVLAAVTAAMAACWPYNPHFYGRFCKF